MKTFLYVCGRLNELQSNKQRLADSEADKQRLMRDGEELITKMQWLQKINVQVRIGCVMRCVPALNDRDGW